MNGRKITALAAALTLVLITGCVKDVAVKPDVGPDCTEYREVYASGQEEAYRETESSSRTEKETVTEPVTHPAETAAETEPETMPETETAAHAEETQPERIPEQTEAVPEKITGGEPEKAVTETTAVAVEQPAPAQKQTSEAPETEPVTEAVTEPETMPETETAAPAAPKIKTIWDAPYDVEAIKNYIITELKARGYEYSDEYWMAEAGDDYIGDLTPDDCAWDNYCTTTAGPQRFYDRVNKCAVGHQHYRWSEPFDGSEAENGEASLEWMVNHAINYWDNIFGQNPWNIFIDKNGVEHLPTFLVYVESFDDGCVIFYILLG